MSENTSTTTSTTTNRIAVITGGSRGLGRSMALHLAERGVGVIFTYRTRESEALEVVGLIEAKGQKAVALQLDVSKVAGYADFAESVRARLTSVWGRESFDYLVNNAGTGLHASIAETTEAQFDEMVDTHLKATFFLTQRLVPLMADGGRIVNVSTGLTRFTLPGYGAYAAMKGGVEVLTRYMAKELGARKIVVNTVAPGAIETDFAGGAVRDNKAINRFVASSTALGRVGLPDDVGGAVAMLLSDEAGWINGQRIEVAGGVNL